MTTPGIPDLPPPPGETVPDFRRRVLWLLVWVCAVVAVWQTWVLMSGAPITMWRSIIILAASMTAGYVSRYLHDRRPPRPFNPGQP